MSTNHAMRTLLELIFQTDDMKLMSDTKKYALMEIQIIDDLTDILRERKEDLIEEANNSS